jgi:hypothetical protein
VVGVNAIKAAVGPKRGRQAPMFDKDSAMVEFEKAIDISVTPQRVVLSANQLDHTKLDARF